MGRLAKSENLTNKNIVLISDCLIGCVAIAFLLLYFVLSFYNRPASDDILFISIIKEKSLFEYVKQFYFGWSGRWASNTYFYIINSISKSFINIHFYLFLYYCLTIVLMVYSVNSIICFGLKKLTHLDLNKSTSIIYSILFIGSFYFLTFNHIEVWWWVCGSVDTLQGIVFLLFGVALLLNEKKLLFHYILIVLCFIYVGGAFEIYALITGVLLIVLIIVFFKRKHLYFTKKLLIALIALVLASAISLPAPGNMRRKEIENIDTAKTIKVDSATQLESNFIYQKKFIIGIGLSALFMLLGINLKSKSQEFIYKKHFKQVFLFLLLTLLLSITITWSFQSFILNGSEIPLRGWTFTSFALCCLLCFAFFMIGLKIKETNLSIKLLLGVLLPAMVFIVLLISLYRQYNYVSIYANEYDKLITSLIDAKKDKNLKTFYVKELPNSGMFVPMDISDSSITVPIRDILNLNYDIKIQK